MRRAVEVKEESTADSLDTIKCNDIVVGLCEHSESGRD